MSVSAAVQMPDTKKNSMKYRDSTSEAGSGNAGGHGEGRRAYRGLDGWGGGSTSRTRVLSSWMRGWYGLISRVFCPLMYAAFSASPMACVSCMPSGHGRKNGNCDNEYVVGRSHECAVPGSRPACWKPSHISINVCGSKALSTNRTEPSKKSARQPSEEPADWCRARQSPNDREHTQLGCLPERIEADTWETRVVGEGRCDDSKVRRALTSFRHI